MNDRKRLYLVLVTWAALLPGCGSNDDRLHDLARESLKQQAEQNSQMAQQTQTIADATDKLVEADSESRQQHIELQRELQLERANLDRQHEDLDQERQQIAESRRWDSVLGPSVLSAAGILAAVLPLVVCLLLLWRFSANDYDQGLDELLIQELTSENPLLLSPAHLDSRKVLISETESSGSQKLLSEQTGVLPVNESSSRLLIIVEGEHDVTFLKQISSMLHTSGKSVPDLSLMEETGKVVFVPTGGNVNRWGDRFSGLGFPEFHLFDREVSPVTEQRRVAIKCVNQREGCQGVLTKKRSIENYLHPQAITDGLEVEVNFGDFDDVAERVAQATFRSQHQADWSSLPLKTRKRLKERAKVRLHNQSVPRMTAELLAERDSEGEVIGWLTLIDQMLQPNNSQPTL